MDWVLIVIIGLNCLVSFKGFDNYTFMRKYDFHIGSIRSGEQIRILTSGFLHVDIMHLSFNMITLYFFAPWVIQILGVLYFVYIYLGSLILGSFFSLYLYKNDYSYRAVGASGAVMGVVYSLILLDVNDAFRFYGFIPSYVFGVGYLLYSVYGIKAKNDRIGHAAHFGGAMGGYLITLMKKPELIYLNTKMVVFLFLPLLLLVYLYKNNKI